MEKRRFAGRAGEKLAAALGEFGIDVKGKVVADLGSAVGGFVSCLISRGAKRVYAVEAGYGILDWELRNDLRVVVMERTNAMYVKLPEKVDLVTIDTGWTKLEKVVGNASLLLKRDGKILCLLKPHYEVGKARLTEGEAEGVRDRVLNDLKRRGFVVERVIKSPIKGGKGKNTEYLVALSGSVFGSCQEGGELV